MILTIEIDLEKQRIYIGQESGSGAEYSANSSDDVGAALKFYLDTYYADTFKNNGGKLK